MPTTHAAAKAQRKGAKQRARNVAEKAAITKILKQARKALDAKKADDAAKHGRTAIKALDKAVAHGIMKKNTAARLKSRLAKRINALGKTK